MEKTNREIAEALDKSSSEFKKERVNVKNEQKALRRSQILELKKKGWSNLAVARILGINENTVRLIAKASENNEH